MAGNLFTNLLNKLKGNKVKNSIDWFKGMINMLSGRTKFPPSTPSGDIPAGKYDSYGNYILSTVKDDIKKSIGIPAGQAAAIQANADRAKENADKMTKAEIKRILGPVSQSTQTTRPSATAQNSTNSKGGPINSDVPVPEKYISRSIITGEEIGKLFMFSYDPKTKDTLPYYDTFPLVFPFSLTSNGFIGINMHYLPPVLRARLMDALFDLVAVDEKGNQRLGGKKAKDLYTILKSASKFRYFQPCIKRYLTSHRKSPYYEIPVAFWDYAMTLQIENFKKATKEQVWEDSANFFNKPQRPRGHR